MSGFRSGTVGLVGRPNTGKSSLLNKLLGQKLAIVSPREQTTRHLLMGVLTTADCQYVFVDAPGFQTQHRNLLNRSLNRRAGEAARDMDVVAFVLEALHYDAADRAALARVPEGKPVVAVVNKIDLVRPAEKLLPFLERVARERAFHAIVPVSAATWRNLPELLREKIFRLLGEELPYRCDVIVDSFREEGRLRRIEATLWVERDSHKPIVLGKGGAMLKRLSTDARKDMESLFGGKVFLQVWVKVRRRWTDDERLLRQLGYA